MDPARISDLLRPFLRGSELKTTQLESLQTYLTLLMRWNARMNLTAVREEETIVTRHIGESLFAARHAVPDANASLTVIDLGSGAGFPGLPLKIYAPKVSLTLIESQNKKATFLKEAIRTLHLDGVRVLSARAEAVEAKAELVTMRAVEQFDKTLPIAAALVSSEALAARGPGRIALLIGEAQVEKTAELTPHFVWQPPVRIPLSASRVVLVGQHTAPQAAQ